MVGVYFYTAIQKNPCKKEPPSQSDSFIIILALQV